jgi:hypothetical protein
MIDRRTPSALSAAPRLDRLTGVLRGSTLGLALCLVPAASANEEQPPWVGQDPVTDALVELGPVVQTYNQHLMFLASPYLGGRLPGTPGMALARDYCEHHLRLAGLEPAFRGADGTPSFRQPFPLAGTAELVSQSLVLGSGQALVAGEDFTALSLGDSGSVRGPAVFVGYSINRAPEDSGYTSYPEGTDLSGRIAVLFRFEPMDADGHSQWATGNNPWSSRAGFAGKVRAAERLGAAAIVIVNPPGAADPRTEQLNSFRSGGKVVDVPVFHLSTAAGERLLAAGSVGQSLLDLRRQADERGVVLDLGLELVADVAIEQTELMAAAPWPTS